LSTAIVVRDAQEERVYGSDDLPLAVGGGPDAPIPVPGAEADGPLALLGISNEQVFVQPGAGGVPVTCNGRLLESSRWLRHGDSIQVGQVRIHCEFTPERLDFHVHRTAPEDADPAQAEGPAPLAPEEIEPIAYAPVAHARVPWHRRIRFVPALLAAFFLRSACSLGFCSPQTQST
jgi:hypothetical protein